LRERASKSGIKRFEDPEERRKSRERSIKQFEDPAMRKLMSDIQIERFKDPLERERIGDAVRKAYEDDPTLHQKMSELQKKAYRENPERRRINSESHIGVLVGPRNPRWRGGITPLNKQIRECNKMKEWIKNILERDNYSDWFSGCGGRLEIHHIISFERIMKKYNIRTLEEAIICEDLWDTNNGVTMLKSSHKAYHAMWGR